MSSTVTAPKLRTYQHELIKGVRGALRSTKRVLLQAPTGSGKTVLTAYMIGRAAEQGYSSWFVVHRRELLEQTSDALWESGVPHGRIASGYKETKDQVQVTTIQTLVRRLDRLPPPTFLVVDEAHHAPSKSYRKTLDHASGSWVVGLPATPTRLDGKGLNDLFDGLVLGPTVADLIEAGYLSPYKLYRPPGSEPDLSSVGSRGGDWVRSQLEHVVDNRQVVGDAVSHYRKYVAPRSCLVYCVSRIHARHVEEAYRSAGIDARYCAGDTPKSEREAIVSGLKRCDPPVVVSVDLFGEGLDAPGLAAVQMLRPTQSLTLYLQQAGRVLRPESGKEHAIILDHVGNSERHGLPCDEREWSLEGIQSREGAGDSGPSIRNCENCFVVFRAILGACPNCGWLPPKDERDMVPEEVEGELEEVDPDVERRLRRVEQGRAKGLRDLVELAIERGNKPSWAGIVFASRRGNRVPRAEAIRRAWSIYHEIKGAS